MKTQAKLNAIKNKLHGLLDEALYLARKAGREEIGAATLRALGVGAAANDTAAPQSNHGARGKPRPAKTRAQARQRKLQGQYMGSLRGLNRTDAAKAKKIAAEKGQHAAIKFAQSRKGK